MVEISKAALTPAAYDAAAGAPPARHSYSFRCIKSRLPNINAGDTPGRLAGRRAASDTVHGLSLRHRLALAASKHPFAHRSNDARVGAVCPTAPGQYFDDRAAGRI